MTSPRVDVRRAGDRALTTHPGGATRHSFSFGTHYDPENTHHGLLLAHNDERLDRDGGFPDHPHGEVEIVSWVVAGTLRHAHTHAGEPRPGPTDVPAGCVQVLGAGSGLRHAETAAPSGPVHFVQMWLTPERAGLAPRYAAAAAPPGDWVALASGLPGVHAVLPVRTPGTLHLGRLAAGAARDLPAAPYLHLFVVAADRPVTLEVAGPEPAALGPGDAARLTGTGGRLTATAAAQVLVWEMHADRSVTLEG